MSTLISHQAQEAVLAERGYRLELYPYSATDHSRWYWRIIGPDGLERQSSIAGFDSQAAARRDGLLHSLEYAVPF